MEKNHNNDFYIKHFYSEVLDNLNPQDVYNKLYELSVGKDCVLLCYEKSDDFCHRHIVAKWLEDNLGIIVKEWGEDA